MQRQTPVPRDIHRLFVQTDHEIVAVFKVEKCYPSSKRHGSATGAHKSKGERALVLTWTRRRGRDQSGGSGSLHLCKNSQGSPQVRKSLKTRTLTRAECAAGSDGVVTLLFRRQFSSGDERISLGFPASTLRLEFLGILSAFCLTVENRRLEVTGVSEADIRGFGSAAAKDAAVSPAGDHLGGPRSADMAAPPRGGFSSLGDVSSRGSASGLTQYGGSGLTPAAAVTGVYSSAAAPARPRRVSQTATGTQVRAGSREDRQLDTLLELVVGAGGGAEEVAGQLVAELAALEDAGVHELLENEGQVARLGAGVTATLALLSDLDDSLAVFDAKLALMHQDVNAIESRNNALEQQSRNAGALLDTLDSLLLQLRLGPQTEALMLSKPLTIPSMPAMVAASEEVEARLAALSSEASALPLYMQEMAAVRRRQGDLRDMQAAFTKRALDFVNLEISSIEIRPSLPLDLAQLHAHLRTLRPLVEVVGKLRPGALTAMRGVYAAAVGDALAGAVAAAVAAAVESARSGPSSAQHMSSMGSGAMLQSRSSFQMQSKASSFKIGNARLVSSSFTAGSDSAGPMTAKSPPAFVPQLGSCMGQALDAAVPLVRREAQLSCELIALGGKGEKVALDKPDADLVQLFVRGVSAKLQALVGEIAGLGALSAVPALAAVLGWQARLTAEAGSGATVEALQAMLKRLGTALQEVLQGYANELTAAIQKYALQRSTSSLSGSAVKTTHVFPFVPPFLRAVVEVEACLGPSAFRAGSGPKPPSGGRGVPRPSPFGAPGPATGRDEPVAQTLGRKIFTAVLAALLASVEDVAARDEKHGPRIRLENYILLQRTFQPRGDVVAAEELERLNTASFRAEATYIEQQVDYFGFGAVLALSRKLDDLTEQPGPPKGPAPISQQDAVALFDSCTHSLSKKLVAVSQRLGKHFAGSSPELVGRIWQRLEGICLSRWERIPRQLQNWYPGFTLPLSQAQLQGMFKSSRPDDPLHG